MNKTRDYIVKFFLWAWAIGLVIILLGGAIFGYLAQKDALELLKAYLTGSSAIFTGILGYYFGKKPKVGD
jgi:hypothetical protein